MDMHGRIIHTANNIQGVNTNKVYINPYFNSYYSTNTYTMRENVSMHFNPNFAAPIPRNDSKNLNSKIFINPNFVKPVPGNATSIESYECEQNNSRNNVNILLESVKEPINIDTKLTVPKVNKSRYSIVRYGTITVKEKVNDNQSKTIKVNRYKSVPLADFKKNIMSQHNIVKLCSSINDSKTLPLTQKSMVHSEHIKKYINRYKYVKCKPASVSFDGNKRVVTGKASIVVTRKNNKLKIRTKGIFKKNNIPCPLYKKFGKCIRNIQGKCDFLHDKRHVTLCRKFLKGICFDNECLLSHDITTKKMPTCYFYLKGMCTKTDCPYVHIKLNDETKSCPDFLKGYCERGKKCGNRHVSVVNNTKAPSCYKYKREEKSKVKKKPQCLQHKSMYIKNELIASHPDKQDNILEGRYYEDQGKWKDYTNDATSEVIKPTRCKLGSLPSFIQLHN